MEDFFGGRVLFGGFFREGLFWEEFFVYIGIDLFVKILSQGKKEGRKEGKFKIILFDQIRN